MKNLSFLAIASLALVGCGDDGGTTGGNADAAPDVSSMLTISGVASEITTGGRTPQAGVAITVYKVSDDSMIGMATTDANGAYSITVTTNGSPVDGYLKATKSGLKDTYLYPPGPLSSDFAGVTTLMLKQSTQNLANQVGGAAAPDPTKGWIAMLVLDAPQTSAMTVMGATVSASPTGEIRYNGSAGIPAGTGQAMSTAMDGIAYAMNVPAGQVTVGASKSGLTFKSHAVNARADKITLTLVTP
jgi:hypothetical protein